MGNEKSSKLFVRRRTDKGFLCWLALRAGQLWDFIDKRDIDNRLISIAILWGTVKITEWAMDFAVLGNRPGLEVAAIIGAVGAPYMALQSFAIKWYFERK